MVKGWREYPKNKPKKSGWYICSIYIEQDALSHEGKDVTSYVMDLWYDFESDKWKDNRRKNVYDVYEVYGRCPGPNETVALERKFSDRLCIRDDVVAFKNLPKPYK